MASARSGVPEDGSQFPGGAGICYIADLSRAPALSPGLLAGNPPPRRGAPGEDMAAPDRVRQARIRASGSPSPGPGGCDAIPASSLLDPQLVPVRVARRRPSRGADRRRRGGSRVSGQRVRYVNLDYAASAPALRAGHRPGEARCCRCMPACTGAPDTRRRSARPPTRRPGGDVAAFLGAGGDDVVVFTRNTTDALNLLARRVPGPSCTWTSSIMPTCCPGGHGARWCSPSRRSRRRWTASTPSWRASPAALLAVTGASNVTGECCRCSARRGRAARGARIAVDGAQLVPHRRVDCATPGSTTWRSPATRCTHRSARACWSAGGTGWTRHRRTWPAAVPCARSRLGTAWAAAPARHEAGTPNVIGAVAGGGLPVHRVAAAGPVRDTSRRCCGG